VLNLPYTFLWRPRSARIFLYLSKLATQMVTSTPLENLSLLLYEPQNKNFNLGTTKTLILHARSIFFRGGHIPKIWSKKIFFMKTLSKLGALTVYTSVKKLGSVMKKVLASENLCLNIGYENMFTYYH
jgi:hypothetical protein